MARYQQSVGLKQVGIAQPTLGGENIGLTLSDRLEQFRVKSGNIAAEQAVKRGQATAAEVRLQKKDGVTQSPELKKENLVGMIESQAHNKALKSAYIASLDTDIKTNIARIQAENPDNLIGFNEASKSFSKGVIENVDPLFRTSAQIALEERIGSAQIKVQAATIKKQKEKAKSDLEISESTLYDDSILSARNGDIAQSAKSIVDYHTNIDAQVEAGFITGFEASEKKRELELAAANENLVGQLRVKLDADNFEGVIKTIQDVRLNPPKGRTIEETEDLLDMMTSEVSAGLNLKNKLEDLEEKDIEKKQTITYVDRFEGIVSTGTTSLADIIADGRAGNLSETQVSSLTNMINNKGRGVDNFSLINSINEEIAANKDPDYLREVIISTTGEHLTNKTATELMAKVTEMESGESVLYNNKAKRARTFIQKRFGLTGPLASLDFEQNKRLANAERTYEERVLNGEDPFMVADELVGKNEFNIAPDPMFGNKDNLEESLNKLNQAFDSKEIKEEDYNFEFNKIKNLKLLKENITAFDNEVKNVR